MKESLFESRDQDIDIGSRIAVPFISVLEPIPVVYTAISTPSMGAS